MRADQISFSYDEMKYLAGMLIAEGAVQDGQKIGLLHFKEKKERKEKLRHFRHILTALLPILDKAAKTEKTEPLSLKINKEDASILQKLIGTSLRFMEAHTEVLNEETEKFLAMNHSLYQKFGMISED